MRYPPLLGLHTGKIIQGAIVLDDAEPLEEDDAVTVWVERSDEPLRVTDEELCLVRQGQAEATRGEGLDARDALRRMRGG